MYVVLGRRTPRHITEFEVCSINHYEDLTYTLLLPFLRYSLLLTNAIYNLFLQCDGIFGRNFKPTTFFIVLIYFCLIWICKLSQLYLFNCHVCTQASYGEPLSHLQAHVFLTLDRINSMCYRSIYVDCTYMILCS